MVCERGMWEGECRYVIPIHCYSTITTRLGLGIAPRNDIKSGGVHGRLTSFYPASKNEELNICIQL